MSTTEAVHTPTVPYSEVVEFFYQPEGLLLPVPPNISLDHLVQYWVEQGFERLRMDTEIAIAEEIEQRLAITSHLMAKDKLLGQLVLIDARCRHADSLSAIERAIKRLTGKSVARAA